MRNKICVQDFCSPSCLLCIDNDYLLNIYFFFFYDFLTKAIWVLHKQNK